MKAIAPTQQEAEQLLLKQYRFYHRPLVPKEFHVEDLESPAGQVIAALYLRHLLAQFPREPGTSVNLEGMPFRAPSSPAIDRRTANLFPEGLSRDLDTALSREDLLPFLRGLAWATKFVLENPTTHVIRKFLAEVPMTNVHGIPWTWNLHLHWPLLMHAARLMASGKSVPQGLLAHLDPSKQQGVTKDLIEIIERGAELLSKDRRTILINAIHMNDSEEIVRCLPGLQRIADQVGLEATQLLDCQ